MQPRLHYFHPAAAAAPIRAVRRPTGKPAGFTLLELLVAITLMGLLLVVLYGGLRIGLRGWDAGEQRAEATQQLRLVHEFLRRQLAQSMTVYQFDDQQNRTVVFAGQADGIEFVTPMLVRLGQAGLYRVRIEVVDGRLWIRWRPYLPNDPAAGEERERVLLEEVSAVEWAYFGLEQFDDPQPRWSNAWTNPQIRPLLVRLNLKLRDEPWPDLVVALVEGPR